MNATYEAIGKQNDLANQERAWRKEIKGFTRVGEVAPYTPLREPGDEQEDAA
jgi:hypothetical protein